MRHSLALVLAVLLGAGGLSASADPVPADAAAAIGAADAQCAFDEFSGSLLLARDGKVIARHACGYFNRYTKTPVTLDTRYNIGSVGKMFTVALTLQKFVTGEWTPDTTIAQLWPDSGIPNADKITLSQLMNHSSGLGNYFRAKAFSSSVADLDTVIDIVRSQPVQFAPGEGSYYSNSGYVVLGKLLERAYGKPWRELYAERIWKPAGMNPAPFFDPNQHYDSRPHGYFTDRETGKLVETTGHEPVSEPDGGEYLTVEDLWRFHQWLFDGNHIDPAWMARARQPMTSLFDGKAHAGWGWEFDTMGGVPVVMKGGGTPTAGCFFGDFSLGGHTYTLILLSNLGNGGMAAAPGVISAIAGAGR